ncbi:MAG: hotdog domain-containing protein [Vampirovibrionales bacterium]|nr:hotdog domain-containing protein [Vampirovibrionales bacterium]
MTTPDPHALIRVPDDTAFTLRVPAYPSQSDGSGMIRASTVLKLIDIAGAITAKRHVTVQERAEGVPELTVVTAMLDRTNFINPVRPWDIISAHSRLTRVWRTSMECQVTVSAWNFQTDETLPIATSYLIYVGVGTRGQKVPEGAMPGLQCSTDDEKNLAADADARKLNREQEAKATPVLPVAEPDEPEALALIQTVEQAMTPNDANANGNVFGGVILALVHDAGRKSAEMHALSGPVACVRQDRMSFVAPVYIGETVRAQAILTQSWTTSMEIQVDVHAINPLTGQTRLVASSYLVYVRLGFNDRPTAVPPWTPKTAIQQQRTDSAQIRRKTRMLEAQRQQTA